MNVEKGATLAVSANCVFKYLGVLKKSCENDKMLEVL